VFEELFSLCSQPTSPIHIQSVWLIEIANHGDSYLLNESLLTNNFKSKFVLTYYAAGLTEFLNSGLVDLRDPYLVPVAHCGGGGAVVYAIRTLLNQGVNIQRLILFEPMLWDKRIEPIFESMENQVVKSNRKRQSIWIDLDDAMLYHKARHPWKAWDPRVLDLMKVWRATF